MNLILLKHGYPIAVITNERRKQYIDALVYAQEHGDDASRLLELVVDASRESLIEYLRILSTAEESKEKAAPFYRELLETLKSAEKA